MLFRFFCSLGSTTLDQVALASAVVSWQGGSGLCGASALSFGPSFHTDALRRSPGRVREQFTPVSQSGAARARSNLWDKTFPFFFFSSFTSTALQSSLCSLCSSSPLTLRSNLRPQNTERFWVSRSRTLPALLNRDLELKVARCHSPLVFRGWFERKLLFLPADMKPYLWLLPSVLDWMFVWKRPDEWQHTDYENNDNIHVYIVCVCLSPCAYFSRSQSSSVELSFLF